MAPDKIRSLIKSHSHYFQVSSTISRILDSISRTLKRFLPVVVLIIFSTGSAGILMFVEDESCNGKNPGYGSTYPCTQIGRALTLFLAFLGLPLTVFCLERMGSALERSLESLWRKRHEFFFAYSHRKSSTVAATSSEDVMPISLGLAITCLWVLASSMYFYLTVDPVAAGTSSGVWNFFSSIYFTIISLTTIGLGDIVPSTRRELVLINTIVIFGGLIIMTMCLNLVQRRIEALFDATSQSIRDQYNKAIQKANADGSTTGMVNGEAEEDIDNLPPPSETHADDGFLWYLMSKKKKAALAEQWRGRASMVNRQTQTEWPGIDRPVQASVYMIEQGTFVMVRMADRATQYRDPTMLNRNVQTTTIGEVEWNWNADEEIDQEKK